MRIAVGSTNPSKVGAVRRFLKKIAPDFECEAVQGVKVDSGVSEQPMSDKETIAGATYRAKEALLRFPVATWGIGLEGGVQESKYGMFLCNWGAVAGHDGKVFVGGGVRLLLPESFAEEIRKGKTLGEVVRSLTGDQQISTKGGAVALLTRGGLDREEVFEQVTAAALAPLLYDQRFRTGS